MNLNSLNLQGVEEKRPLLIAGPCSAETEDQVLETAKQLASNGVKVFRAGVWKPRTKPGGFEGNGVTALPWLQKVKKETGMLTATEVATAKHVEEALKHDVDLLWVGARTTADPFAVQEIAEKKRQTCAMCATVKKYSHMQKKRRTDSAVSTYSSTTPVSHVWAQSTEDSAPTTRNCTEIFLNGTFLSNYTADILNFLSSATQVISLEEETSSQRFANRRWTSSSTVSS